ncbi:EF-hand domain-containing protein D2-like [Acanthaster planci]|uniref:EF-hand domain-containing protein D2-like n=1 Tax=Acanthaster planci TaxID=133434 RepID=A0A8B7YCT4_ACAPL|nr:EF-hand domain-containing protein D2-like [Acanthaster planci]
MATDELASKLARREALNEGTEEPNTDKKTLVFNPFTEFKEFSRKEIKQYETMFKTYDTDKNHFIELLELKFMMEKLGAPQTHCALKDMIKEVDEDHDGRISFREFLLIFRKAAAGELETDSGLSDLARLTEIDVDKEGVGGAKNFFEAKINEQTKLKKFEEEIKQEQEEKKIQEEEKKKRRAEFKAKQEAFKVA